MPVLLHRISVVAGMIGVVVDAVHRDAMAPRRIEERRLPDACVEQDLRMIIDVAHDVPPLSFSSSLVAEMLAEVLLALVAEDCDNRLEIRSSLPQRASGNQVRARARSHEEPIGP